MPLQRPKLVIFDVDGTLMVSRRVMKAMELLCGELKVPFPREMIESITEAEMIRGEGGRVLHRQLEGETLPKALYALENYLATTGHRYDEDTLRSAIIKLLPLVQDYYLPYDGAADFIKTLRREGVSVAFVTNAERAVVEGPLLQHEIYDPAHDLLLPVNGDDYEKDARFKQAMAHFDIAPGKDVWSVGDDLRDINPALEMGCTAIGYGYNNPAVAKLSNIDDPLPWQKRITREEAAVAHDFESLQELFAQSKGPARGL